MGLKSKTLAVLILAFQIGCAVGPDYSPPQIDVSQSFESVKASSFKNEQALTDWWHSFDDAALNELIETAVKNNNDIKVALGRVKESRAAKWEKALDLVPTVRGEAGYSRTLSSQTRVPVPDRKVRDVQRYDAALDASWELDLFGRVRRSVEAQNAETEATQAELDDALRVVLAEVAKNYFDLRGTQHELVVARSNAKNQEETVKITEAMVAGGQSTELDNARARGQLGNTRATIPALELSERLLIYRLSVLVGKQPHELVETLKDIKPLPTFQGAVNIGKPEELLRNRPDVRVAERRLAEATAGIGVAMGDIFPRVSFIGSVAMDSFSPRRFGDGAAEAWSFGPSLTWAALDMGRVITRIHAADARTEQALAAYQQAVLRALEETEGALYKFSKDRERRDFLKDAAAQTDRAAKLARVQYQSGLIDFLSVLESERSVFQAQDELTKSETALITDLVGIYKALGGGWLGYELKAS